MSDRPVISVVPALDEEASLPALAARRHDARKRLGIPSEVVVVDDGRRDQTWAVIERLHRAALWTALLSAKVVGVLFLLGVLLHPGARRRTA